MSMLRIGLLVLICPLVSACTGSGRNADYGLLEKESITCAPPAQVEIQPWGKIGLSKSCRMVDGPFVGVENGYVLLRGQYEAGREVGIWRWYDKDGNVVKTIDYSKPDQSAN